MAQWGPRGEHSKRRMGVGAASACVALLAAAAMPATAGADRSPTKKEAKVIKRAFMKERDKTTTVKRIRVSTADPDYAAVHYSVRYSVPAAARVAAKPTRAPTPAVLKERKSGKWKVVGGAPKKVLKDVGAKRRSDIRLSGEVSAVLTRPAACTSDREYYGAGIYKPDGDVYLSIQMHRWSGFGAYPALGAGSLGSLSVGNAGGEPQYVTGQSNNAFADSGVIYVDREGWGLIDAGLARYPDSSGFPPISVDARGYWVCR